MIRKSTAVWNGTGKEGNGHLTTQSSALSKTKYTWSSRFEDADGTNPEELIAAAHAGCFSMKLSFLIVAAGFTPETLETTCTVNLSDGMITTSHLDVKGKVPGISEEVFQKCVKEAELTCPVSKSLKSTITSEGKLI